MEETESKSGDRAVTAPSSSSRMQLNIQSYFDELSAVEGGSGDVSAVRRALQRILFEVVERVWEGDTEAAASCLEQLQPVSLRIRKVLAATEEEPLVEAMRYSHDMMQVLLVMDQALDSSRTEKHWRSEVSEIKRAVLYVLRDHAEQQHLSRKDVHKRLEEQGHESRTVHRIGQILEELYSLNLVTRVELTGRGGRAAHYRLSPAGRQLCERLADSGREMATGDMVQTDVTETARTRKATWISPDKQDEVLKRRVSAA